MKLIMPLLLMFLSYNSYTQITLLEIQRVYKMDFDQFEAYAISKGYQLNKFENDENMNGIVYLKGVGKATKYIEIYDKFFRHKKHFGYQTFNTNEILNLKTQLKNSSFKLYLSYFSEDGIKTEEYRNNVFELIIHTKPPGEYPAALYEIAYRKIPM